METKTLPALEAGEYAGGLWYYEPHVYLPYRYVLGRPGARPLVCIGINPSTAQPGALDPTVKSVERLAAANGFDSWIMFNVYPQRATDPNDMDRTPDRALCDENLRWLAAVLAQTDPTMWAAWGTLIEKRPYLPALMREMVALTREKGAPWVTFGRRSKAGLLSGSKAGVQILFHIKGLGHGVLAQIEGVVGVALLAPGPGGEPPGAVPPPDVHHVPYAPGQVGPLLDDGAPGAPHRRLRPVNRLH